MFLCFFFISPRIVKFFFKKVCCIKKSYIFAPSNFSIFDCQFLIVGCVSSQIKNHHSKIKKNRNTFFDMVEKYIRE